MSRFFYSLLVALLMPVAVIYLLWRSRRQPEYLKHWRERFACYGGDASDAAALAHDAQDKSSTLWLHAVSVGETRAAQPLVAALRQLHPQCRILLTHTTPTGLATSEALFGTKVARCYLPYDTPWAMHRFLRRYRPRVCLIMETELWPNCLAACLQAGIPAFLVNARLSEKSANGYRRFAGLTRVTLNSLTGVAAQTQADAARLSALGAKSVVVTGNLKFDILPPIAQLEIGASLRAHARGRGVFLCASTREGEEALILAAWRGALAQVGAGKTANSSPPLLLIVPRHPQRFDEVAIMAQALGFRVQRRSQMASITLDTDVLIGDSMGEMFAYYTAADVCFVGGSLLDFGCQNLIEPCSVGTPVLIGRSTFNFAEAAAAALASGAALQVVCVDELIVQALQLLASPDRRAQISAAGRVFAAAHQGATARTMALIAPHLERDQATRTSVA